MRRLLLQCFDHQTLSLLRQDLRLLPRRIRGSLGRGDATSLKPDARFVNVGCGPNGVASADWLNLDGFPAPGVDRVCDLRRPLPLPDGRYAGIFSEHFFEHLRDDQAGAFLRECLRALAPGGTLRLSVPDGELYLRNYFEDRAWMLERRGGRFSTPMEVVNYVFRQGYEHQFCYDFETLERVLVSSGFEDVRREDFGSGRVAELLVDQEVRRFESLYVEARRP